MDSILEEIRKNRKRTEANIAILRDIEITQTKPTNIMLLSLFGENLKEQKPARREKVYGKPKPHQKEMDTKVPKVRYERLQDEMKGLSQDFQYVLGKARLVKSSFGKPYLKLEISRGELARYKRKVSKSISGE